MNNDLISRSALIKAFHTDIVNHMQYIDDSTVSVCIAEIEEAPAVDAAPEAHGRWEHLGGDEWICTACGHVISTEGSWDLPTAKYCEECGARMDGGLAERSEG